MRNFERVEVMA